jgi:protein gp37
VGDKSGIEWTEATWNPVTGCTKVSPACANCYIARTPPFRMHGRQFVKGHIPLEFHENRLDQPLRWRKPRRIFVNSLSDLFHEDVPDLFIDRVFAVMALCRQHTFQVLTKRPARMRGYFDRPGKHADVAVEVFKRFTVLREAERHSRAVPWPLPNVWLGVSVENQHFADERIPLLLQTPAAVRFLSCEPLLGPIDLALTRLRVCRNEDPPLDWVIAGGESGHGARPMYPEWARAIRDQCVAAGVPFFFKQWGEWRPVAPRSLNIVQVGKKAAGRLLDGQEWNQMPEVRA